jgi:hypothetical protein
MDGRMSEANTRRRLVVIGLVVVALFAGLLTRLWFLQVAGGEDLAVAAQQNGDKIVQVPAIRGRILDAKGRVLAETQPVTSLVIDRQKLTDVTRAKLVANLVTLLPDTAENINKAIDNPNYPGYQSIPIRKGVSDEIATALVEHAGDYPEASLESSYARVYPAMFGQQLAAHAVGFQVSAATIGVAVLLTTVIIVLLVGYYLLKIPYDDLVGVASGATGNPSILVFSNRMAPTERPDIGYAMIFPSMTIVKVIAVQILGILAGSGAAGGG